MKIPGALIWILALGLAAAPVLVMAADAGQAGAGARIAFYVA
jgi:hypothetical protein